MHAFQNCEKLEDIQLPESLTKIGEGCFKNSGLINISISKAVKQIAKETFCDCINMKNVYFEEGLEYIGENAFKNDNKLNTVVLPDSI